jgi:hypothetical protein
MQAAGDCAGARRELSFQCQWEQPAATFTVLPLTSEAVELAELVWLLELLAVCDCVLVAVCSVGLRAQQGSGTRVKRSALETQGQTVAKLWSAPQAKRA